LLVSHRERRIEHWQRHGADWRAQSAGRGGVLRIAALRIDVEVDAVYDRSPLTQSL